MKAQMLLLAFLIGIQVAAFGDSACSAEYQGRDLDGETISATAYSYSTSKYYYVDVEFSGDEVTVYFPKGGKITLSLDDEEIDDVDNISAFDYEHGVYWDIDLDL